MSIRSIFRRQDRGSNEVSNEDYNRTKWERFNEGVRRFAWLTFCCGIPGFSCFYCSRRRRFEMNANEELEDVVTRGMMSYIEGTASLSQAEVNPILRPHRPYTPGSRKTTPEVLSVMRHALSDLQGHDVKDSSLAEKLHKMDERISRNMPG